MILEINYKDIIVKVNIISEYRPAPICYDHDSPAFSDSGDDGEWEIVEIGINNDGEDVHYFKDKFVFELVHEDLINDDKFNEQVWETFYDYKETKTGW